MDPKLLKEREAFKRRALAQPTIEKKKVKVDDSKKPDKAQKPRPAIKRKEIDYKNATGSSGFKFGILAKIVKHMRTRHQTGDNYPLDIDELLDETNQTDIRPRDKHWLITESLCTNPKIEVVEGDKYRYKPTLNIRDRKGLARLLEKNDRNGYGGTLMDDVEEALPKAAKVLKFLGDQVTHVQRPIDKKYVLFYNDKSSNLEVSEELQKLWRSATVESVDEGKIEEYLGKQGIVSMQDVGTKRAVPVAKRKGSRKRKPITKTKDNEHVDNVLKDYSEKQK